MRRLLLVVLLTDAAVGYVFFCVHAIITLPEMIHGEYIDWLLGLWQRVELCAQRFYTTDVLREPGV